MTTCERLARRRAAGLTLAELVVAVAVLALLIGAAAPLVRAAVDRGRRERSLAELAALAQALDDHFYDQAVFPPALSDPGFTGAYLVLGVDDTAILDEWGAGAEYVYSLSAPPIEALVRSVGPNGVDDGGAVDDLQVIVPSAVPGNRRTRERMRVITEALANFLESGGLVTGVWPTDRAALGLGVEYEQDGFGNDFELDDATLVLRSAGADGVFGTADDLTS